MHYFLLVGCVSFILVPLEEFWQSLILSVDQNTRNKVAEFTIIPAQEVVVTDFGFAFSFFDLCRSDFYNFDERDAIFKKMQILSTGNLSLWVHIAQSWILTTEG